MLLVHAKITAKPGKRQEIMELAKPCIAASNEEAGILDYRLYASAEDECTLLFIEKYVDKSALKAHAQTAHLQAFAASITELQAEPMAMERFLLPEKE